MYGRSLGNKVRIVCSNKQPNKKLPQVPPPQKTKTTKPKTFKRYFYIKYLRESLPSPLDAQASVLWGPVPVMKWGLEH